VAVDSSGPGLRATAGNADLVKVNRSEANELLGGEHDAASAAHAISARFEVDAIVTDGVRGGFALLGGESLALGAPARHGRFSAGSGDAFLGGLLAALEAGADGREALAAARDAAERNAMCPGQGVLAAR
jgi:fructose-1-phosphate kinase PfkB-like protein